MNTEKLKQDFFKDFGNTSFRGYPLEQCQAIFDFFEQRIKKQNNLNKIAHAIRLKAAIEEAVNWEFKATDFQKSNMTYDDIKQIAKTKIYLKYKD